MIHNVSYEHSLQAALRLGLHSGPFTTQNKYTKQTLRVGSKTHVTKSPAVSISEACKWRHDSDKTQTNKLEWWMILKISLRAKALVPITLVKQNLRLHSLYFPQNTLMLTESRGEFSDLHSIFRLRALCHYYECLKSIFTEFLILPVNRTSYCHYV